jgi:undecaprenyl-diphosphatase
MPALFNKLDETLLRWINVDLSNPIGDFIFPLFNRTAPFFPLIAILLVVLILKNSRRIWLIAGVAILCLIIGDFFIFNPLKQWIARPRPAATLSFVHTALASGATGGFSFPSSHTANAFLLATVLGYFFKQARVAAFIAAGFIGLSRIYVGVHYPSDVMGSALLGWVIGLGLISGGKQIQLNLKTPESSISQFRKTLNSVWGPFIFLFAIQVIRIIWAANAPLDPPPSCVELWNLATDPHSPSMSIWILFGKVWFTLLGSSKLSLWLIPWFFQTLFLALTGFIVLFMGGLRAFWIFGIVSISVPLFSELSFLGTPSMVFEDSDWRSTPQTQAFIFYLILSFPLLIAAIWTFRSHRVLFLLTLLGLLIASTFLKLPCNVLAIATMGTSIVLSLELSNQWHRIQGDKGRWLRLSCAMIAIMGLLVTVGVYNPRFLRKLDISFLPRNNPHYIQTGWSECAAELREALKKRPADEIWVDSTTARNYFQYLLGRDVVVRSRDEQQNPTAHSIIYVQEVYYAQIHPIVMFLPRQVIPTVNLTHPPLFYSEITKKGDPIRQFRVYPVDL